MSKWTFCTFDGLFTSEVGDREEVPPNPASGEGSFLGGGPDPPGGGYPPFGGGSGTPLLGAQKGPRNPLFGGYRPLYISITKWRKVVKMTFWHFDGLLTLEVGDPPPVTPKCGPPPGNAENGIFRPPIAKWWFRPKVAN